MIKGKYLVIILVILLVVVSGTRLLSGIKEKRELADDVEYYLEEQGYSEKDIENKETVRVSQHNQKYAVVVTFMDEVDVEYIYGYQDGHIMQLDVVDKNNNSMLKHLENDS